MSSIAVVLDSGPLGLLTHPQRSEEALALSHWVARGISGGNRILVPAIVYYELKRELIRAGKTSGLRRLDAFVNASPGRYLPLSDGALQHAAELRARARQTGRPTAGPAALDVNVILAAQALFLRGEVVVATTNRKHLAQFVAAQPWAEIPF